jgi:cation transport ATPase
LGIPEKGVTVRDDSAEEHARVAEEARRTAHEQAKAEQERAMAASEREMSEALTRPMTQEVLGQLGLIYGGLILIGVYMVQPFLTAPSIDASARISIVAFAVAIPLLAALVLVNRQEAFRGRLTASVTVTIARVVAQLAAFVGIVAGFWHITWIAGVTFLAAGLVAVGIHSAGFWRVERPDEPTK